MTISEALIAQLPATTAIKAIVQGRVFGLVMDEHAEVPAITVRKTDDEQAITFGGSAGAGLPTFEVTAWASSQDGALDLSDAVVTALRDYAGTMGGAGGVAVTRVFYDGRNGDGEYEPDLDWYYSTMTFRIAHA